MTKLKQFCSLRIEMDQSQICELEGYLANSVGLLFVIYLIGTRICDHAEALSFLAPGKRLVTRLACGWVNGR